MCIDRFGTIRNDSETGDRPGSARCSDGACERGDRLMAPPRLVRLLYGGFFAFNGFNHFSNGEAMSNYAASKGVPAADLLVPFTGGMLLFGGLGVALWRLPRAAAGSIATFLLVTTPMMHDFWAVTEDSKQDEMIQFLKNTSLLGAAFVVLSQAAAETDSSSNA